LAQTKWVRKGLQGFRGSGGIGSLLAFLGMNIVQHNTLRQVSLTAGGCVRYAKNVPARKENYVPFAVIKVIGIW